eukprot:scaffold137380_cov31-Tisochrysis_lutea.AAC.3
MSLTSALTLPSSARPDENGGAGQLGAQRMAQGPGIAQPREEDGVMEGRAGRWASERRRGRLSGSRGKEGGG